MRPDQADFVYDLRQEFDGLNRAAAGMTSQMMRTGELGTARSPLSVAVVISEIYVNEIARDFSWLKEQWDVYWRNRTQSYPAPLPRRLKIKRARR